MPQPPHQKNIVHGSITAGGDVRIGDDYITYHNYFAAQEVKIPHRLTNNIPTNADHILGRATELAQAKDHLAQHQATILFNGIGGIGKTALASKYMAIYGSEYNHLAWITVQSTLAEAFTNNAPLLASLQITRQVQDYIEAKQLGKAFEYLFHQLNLLEHTLVVIDNANDLDDLEQYKNWFDTANCHFLITSRSQPSEWATVEVDSLPEPEAVALFKKLHPSVSADDEAIKNLLSKLFYHTLLIELVAKAGASTGIPFADLQTMIETQFIHHQLLNEVPVPTGKHGSVVSSNPKKAKIEDYIWLIFSQVKGLGEEPKHLLKTMALLPVATPFDLEFLKEHFAFFNISNAVVHLDALIERGWLQKEQTEGQEPYFKMHPLIADVAVKHLGVDMFFSEKYIDMVINLINYNHIKIGDNFQSKVKNMPLAERLCCLFEKEYINVLVELNNRLGTLQENIGDYQKAVKYKEKALQIAEMLYDSESKDIAICQNNLGWAYRNLGKYELAAKYIGNALNVLSKYTDTDQSYIAIFQSNLGEVYNNLGRYIESAELLEMALEYGLKNYNVDDTIIAIYQSNLANVYKELGRFKEAAKLLEKAITSDILNFGKDHPSVARNQSNLADVYRKLGKYEKGIALLKLAILSDLKNFGENHPNTTISQSNLALIYFEKGSYEEAIKLLETVLQSDLKNLGNDHPNVAINQSNLATFYWTVGNSTKAKILWQAAYHNSLKNLGEKHPETIYLKQCVEL